MANLLEQLKSNWIIIAFVASMILWYANTNSRLEAVEAKGVEQETLIEKISQLQLDVAVIKSNQQTQTEDIKYIKQQLQ